MIKNMKRFLIKYNECDKNFVNSIPLGFLEKNYQKIKSFFDYKEDLPKIKINFIYSIKEYEFFYGGKHKKWMSAFSGSNTTIHIFSPSVIEQFTTHNASSIVPTIIHEIAHFFYGYSRLPNIELFNEGISCYFQKEKCETRINFKIKKIMINDPKFIYNVGHLIVDTLVKEFGEKETGKKLVEFLRKYKPYFVDEDILLKFKDIMGIGINELLEKHKVVYNNSRKEVNKNGKN